MTKIAMAIAAHPDDIEFMMAGTLMLLKKLGYETHYMTLSGGDCGSTEYDSEKTKKIRIEEAKNAAAILGAKYHYPICNDFEIFYNGSTLRKLSEVIRGVQPRLILTHSPSDYMEDHMNTSRLTVTAAFVRCVPNYIAGDSIASNFDCTIYHALPHGLRDPLRKKLIPGLFVDTSSVQETKRNALAMHKSQQAWLDNSQKMNSYIQVMEDMSLEVGRMSQKFEYAEGWRRHSHYGFCSEDDDPLRDLGEHYLLNKTYEQALNDRVVV